ncbi:KIF1-binding protein homolog [Harpegnathos saltator]|uniref:KIF-binding protein n=1 Tax=Harpegnathos saltator TaxID=610380 RepID=E2C380_HARSA|nr:KIF1-binding protein homolog [Harpegnathos saltator]EFN77612.1 KIF1-binding protein-like protein [Harpegnathos saltator]
MEAKELNVPANIRDKYLKVRKILDEQGVNNSNELYEATKILKEIIEELNIKLTGSIEPKNEIIMLAITHLNLGIIHLDSEETKSAEEQFIMCTDLLEDRELEPGSILPMISALNQLGILYAQWSEPMKAKVALEKAEKLYIEFTENIRLAPVNVAVAMGMNTGGLSAENFLEKLHTLSLYYLAQVYNTLDDKDRFAAYCHKTLNMQLSQEDVDYIDWALNAATLSQYFIGHDNFSQARYHLAAASHILQKHQNILEAKGQKESSESIAAEYETYYHRSADVARCWVKYGITLLSASKERLLRRVDQEDQCSSDDLNSGATESTKPTVELMRFVDIEPELETITGQVTDQYLLDFEDARPVFLNVQKWLDKAKAYYTLENHASDYARIIQDISQLYRYLSFYELHEDRQAKMHKRRIDVLEGVIKELNPQYYRAVCREIWIELGETYSEILNIKMDRLQASDEKPTLHMITKINHLSKGSISHFRSYLDSLETGKSDDGVPKYSDDQLYQALYTHFLIGRLYNKTITSDLGLRIENMQKSLDAYQFIVNYCDKYPEKAEELKKHEFISLCREFVGLLPLTLHRLKQQLID